MKDEMDISPFSSRSSPFAVFRMTIHGGENGTAVEIAGLRVVNPVSFLSEGVQRQTAVCGLQIWAYIVTVDLLAVASKIRRIALAPHQILELGGVVPAVRLELLDGIAELVQIAPKCCLIGLTVEGTYHPRDDDHRQDREDHDDH